MARFNALSSPALYVWGQSGVTHSCVGHRLVQDFSTLHKEVANTSLRKILSRKLGL